jgi:hypothetical protein
MKISTIEVDEIIDSKFHVVRNFWARKLINEGWTPELGGIKKSRFLEYITDEGYLYSKDQVDKIIADTELANNQYLLQSIIKSKYRLSEDQVDKIIEHSKITPKKYSVLQWLIESNQELSDSQLEAIKSAPGVDENYKQFLSERIKKYRNLI